MGGTTAKAGVIYKGEPLTTGAALIGGYEKALPVQIAMMDIFEVGTGGGSIARVEDDMLRVGPQSAGAQTVSLWSGTFAIGKPNCGVRGWSCNCP
jgi:N-methylhydantoinase A